MAHIPFARDEPADEVLRISSIHPKALRDHIRLYRTLVHGPSPLTPTQREMIGVAVSQLNGCRY